MGSRAICATCCRTRRRLHRHAEREDRRQYARRLRRLHQHLRHPTRRGRQGDGADLLREPRREAGVEPKRAAEDQLVTALGDAFTCVLIRCVKIDPKSETTMLQSVDAPVSLAGKDDVSLPKRLNRIV
jgi:hypothetical protein